MLLVPHERYVLFGLTKAIKEHTIEVIKVQVSFQALEKPPFPGNRLKNCGAS
jgi:hypothetical protein